MASVLAGSSAVFRHIHISRVDGSESERSFWGYFCEYSPPSPYRASASAFVHTQQYFSQLVTLKAASGQLAPRALSEVWDPPLCEARQSRVRAALGDGSLSEFHHTHHPLDTNTAIPGQRLSRCSRSERVTASQAWGAWWWCARVSHASVRHVPIDISHALGCWRHRSGCRHPLESRSACLPPPLLGDARFWRTSRENWPRLVLVRPLIVLGLVPRVATARGLAPPPEFV
jgi:hypothetical protein